MSIESCQILATCFTLDRLAAPDCPRNQKGKPRKHFNPKHPSCKWARATLGNFNWLIDHTAELFNQKYLRYPNKGRHFTHDFFDWVVNNREDCIVPSGPLQEFSIAINKEQSCRSHPLFSSGSVVDKYRLYYTHDKPFVTWSTQIPEWFTDEKYQP